MPSGGKRSKACACALNTGNDSLIQRNRRRSDDSMSEQQRDQWAQWLLQRRHGGDQHYLQEMLSTLYHYRDTVLEHAHIQAGETLLDIGCGDGLIAFGALSYVGEQGKVIFSDISQDLLRHCQTLAAQQGVQDRCHFIQASAEDLSSLKANSVDVITARSVLIYIHEKRQVFREFYRVLKPGGRFSIFEPIIRFVLPEPPHIFAGYDVTPIMPIIQKLRPAPVSSQSASSHPMLDFDEHDLLCFAEEAGFPELYLELQIAITPGNGEKSPAGQQMCWETFLRSSPNPLAPTLEEVMHQKLSKDERDQMTAYLQPLVETRQKVSRSAGAYLWGTKR